MQMQMQIQMQMQRQQLLLLPRASNPLKSDPIQPILASFWTRRA